MQSKFPIRYFYKDETSNLEISGDSEIGGLDSRGRESSKAT